MPTLSLDLILMSTLTWITEKEIEREIKPKETNFVKRKQKNFVAAVRKRRNASCHRGENERQ